MSDAARYLLGDMDAAEKERFEEKYFLDDSVYASLCVAEDELIDSFLCRRLGWRDRRKFTRVYLASPLRAARVEEARRLLQAAWPGGGGSPVARFLRGRRRLVQFCAVSLCLVLLLGGAWLFERAVRWQARAQLAKASPGAPPAAPSAPFASLLLVTGLPRGAAPRQARFEVPAGAEILRVSLAVDSAAAYYEYRASVRTPEGVEVWRQTGLRMRRVEGRTAVTLLLPLEPLSGTDYVCHLEGLSQEGKRFEPLSSYWLGLVRP